MNATTTAGTVELIDPNELILEVNIRTEAPLDKGFIESIRQEGVIQPVLGWRDSEGVHVRAGQRRTLGAREAGVATIPVFVVDVDPENASEADRLVRQLIENEQRAELTDGDRAAAWKALELEGLTVAAIAKRTGADKKRVKTGLDVAANATAASAVQEHALTLDQAAVLMEFEDDAEAVARLVEIAKSSPEHFAHNAQRIRDDRAREQLRADTVQELTEQGFTILDRQPGYYDKTPVDIRGWADPNGDPLTGEGIRGLDGASAHVQVYMSGKADITYYLDDPKAHGLKKRRADGTAPTPMTDEEKAERKRVIENNKAWDAAETVRREWLVTFLGRKTLPKNAPQVIATMLTASRYPVSSAMGKGNALAAELLGIESDGAGWYADPFAGYVDAHPTKAAHVSLAVVLGGVEASTSRDTWRRQDTVAAHYLQTLSGWGYALSPVEQIAAMHTELEGIITE
ncbi:MAG: ParB N-terminal domain-containing protein [Actinobacteria bacterium]|nr:ParB N-terminal domain-containing protein [Actinomycetota bacterium]